MKNYHETKIRLVRGKIEKLSPEIQACIKRCERHIDAMIADTISENWIDYLGNPNALSTDLTVILRSMTMGLPSVPQHVVELYEAAGFKATILRKEKKVIITISL